LKTAEARSGKDPTQERRMSSSTRKANSMIRFIGNVDGATLMEYALLAALASVVALIALLAVLGPKT
jgi:Flp pilus assembly pilin Flp